MRVAVLLRPDQRDCSAPLEYHHPLTSLIYRAIEVSSPSFATLLHKHGFNPDGADSRSDGRKSFRLFVFSELDLPKSYLREGRLRFGEGPIIWQIASPLGELIAHVAIGLYRLNKIFLGDEGARFALDRIETVEPPQFSSRMRFRTLSPLTVSISEEDGLGGSQKHYVRKEDERFGPLIVNNLLEKHRALTGEDVPADALEFEFDWDHIRQYEARTGKAVSRLIDFNGTKIKSYAAPFWLTGEPALIRLAWECGLGAGNSQGFGMIEFAPAR